MLLAQENISAALNVLVRLSLLVISMNIKCHVFSLGTGRHAIWLFHSIVVCEIVGFMSIFVWGLFLDIPYCIVKKMPLKLIF
jgi:hypothetical protein